MDSGVIGMSPSPASWTQLVPQELRTIPYASWGQSPMPGAGWPDLRRLSSVLSEGVRWHG
jgi:hypothetical protein